MIRTQRRLNWRLCRYSRFPSECRIDRNFWERRSATPERLVLMHVVKQGRRKEEEEQAEAGSWRGVHVSSFLHAGFSGLPGCQVIGWAKSRDHEIVRAKRKYPKAVPRHFQNHVLWSRALKCSLNMWTGPQPYTISLNFFYPCEVLTQNKMK